MNGFDRFLDAGRDELSWDPRKVVVRLISSGLPQHGFNRLRTRFLRGLGLRIARGATIAGPIRITGPGRVEALLSIGTGSFICGPLHIDLGASVRIGARVHIGDDVKLLTGTHEIGESAQRCDARRWGAIEIGDGSWIGAAVVVLPGVRIGPGAIVGAGALVAADVGPNALHAGVPAKFVRDLGTGEVASEPASELGAIRAAAVSH